MPLAARLTSALACPARRRSSRRRRGDLKEGAARAFPIQAAAPARSSPSPPSPRLPRLNAASPRPQSSSRRFVATRALAPDAPPDWTLDQVAGLVFGLGMMASFLLAYKVDSAVAKQQRKDLGLCEVCGGLNEKSSCPEKACPLK